MNFNENLFPKSFLVIETIIENAKGFRYFILNVDLGRGLPSLKTVNSLGAGMTEIIRLAKSKLKDDMFHISLLKRHDNGTFNVVGYRESKSTELFNVDVALGRNAPIAFLDFTLANKLICGSVKTAIPKPMFRVAKAPVSLHLERSHRRNIGHCGNFRIGVVIPTSIGDKVRVVKMQDSYKAYYPIIGCEHFDVVELDESDGKSVDCYVDDEGMINGSPVNEYWLRAYKKGLTRQPLFGVCVISMTDIESGESTKTDLSAVKTTLRKFGFNDSELSF